MKGAENKIRLHVSKEARMTLRCHNLRAAPNQKTKLLKRFRTACTEKRGANFSVTLLMRLGSSHF